VRFGRQDRERFATRDPNRGQPHPQPRRGAQAVHEGADVACRDSQRQAAGDHAVDSHHAAGGIRQRAARISGRELDVGAHEAVAARPMRRVDDAGAQDVAHAQRVAERRDELADAQLGRVAIARRRQAAFRDAHPGEVTPLVAPFHRSRHPAAVGKVDLDPRGSCDMGVGDDDAVRRPHHAAARSRSLPRVNGNGCRPQCCGQRREVAFELSRHRAGAFHRRQRAARAAGRRARRSHPSACRRSRRRAAPADRRYCRCAARRAP
jgi:hypothetical protein